MAVFSASQTFVSSDPTFDAAGDLLYGTANDAATVLTVGCENQILTVSACGLPEWVSCLTIPGDLTVEGTTTTISSTVTTIVDPLVIYSHGTTGTPTKDAGFIVERGCSANVGIIWDESADEFAIIGCTSEVGVTAGNVTITAYGNLHALGLTLGTDLTVPNGGTGASTFTDGGILLGSGTGAITAMAVLTDGQMIVGDGTTDPVAESGTTLRTSIGVGTCDSPQFTGIELSHATANTLTGACGLLSIEGAVVYSAGGTDVPLADGGTGASLSDPGADRLLFWDDDAGAVAFLTASTNITICGTNITASGGASVAFSFGLFG